MTRGLLYSGSKNIVFSLWKVYNIHTKDFMIYFYKNILKGDDYPLALQKAKLEMLKNRRSANPRNWSSFILIGE